MNRRNFLLSTAAAGVGISTMGMTQAAKAESPNKQSEAKLRLACYWGGLFPADSDDLRVQKMLGWGFEGVEISGNGGWAKGDFKKRMDDANLEICSMSASGSGAIVSEDESRRQGGIDAMKQAIENAGELGAGCVIYVPAFNGQTKLENKEIRKILVDTMPPLAKFAAEHHTKITLEPLRRDESFFLRQVADGAVIARDCDPEKTGGIATMGDFYHMWLEETDDMGAFISGGTLLNHVHMGNGRSRQLPGQDDSPYYIGFRGLKYIGYHRFCSFECGVKGDPNEEVPKSIAFLRAEWEKAEI